MKSLVDQTDHAALCKGGHDDRARQDFAFTIRNLVTSEWMPSTRTVFDRRASRAYADKNGAPPQSPRQIREAMDADSWYRFYLSARRCTQELIWESVIPPVQSVDPRGGAGARLDPCLTPPRYVGAIDIHCMPGGYLADRGEGDLAAGAVYDRGVYLYMSGLMGPRNDAVGALTCAWLNHHRPDFGPKRILDLGCGVGHATLPYVDAYPDAEVHGLDVGAALIRYADERARSWGKAATFHQMDAEHTGFPDRSFDLVTSHIVLHETSGRALGAILAESYRLLSPGGLMVHVDQPRFDGADAWSTFLQENETFYNNEPFWRAYRNVDLAEAAVAAGFARDDVELDILTADVVRQSQNNQKLDPAAEARRKAGFSILVARRI
jgi:ubiquinone/menaquinone biosynthesis C-methylase UbiE